jgi:hypothetical protein
MQRTLTITALLLIATPYAHAEDLADCMTKMRAVPMPSAIPYMPALRVQEVMPTGMRSRDMRKGDVTAEAMRKDKCLTKMLNEEQTHWTRQPNTP